MKKILVTNDDGVHSEGLRELAAALEPLGESLLQDLRHLRGRLQARYEHEVGAGIVELERGCRASRRHDDARVRA